MFSSAVVRDLAGMGRSPMLARLIRETGLAERCGPEETLAELFDRAFALLRVAGRRDEYVYRAALTQKILLGRHSLRTASMLNEFRAGSSKADLVILNGTATVYEIKSERDSLARLEGQIRDYLKVFATVNVIVGDVHVDAVSALLPADVGVMRLSDRYHIGTVREAVTAPGRICPATLFQSLRVAEAVAILGSMEVGVPDLPNTRMHAALSEIFASLDPAALHAQMVTTLKQTRSLVRLSELVDKLPKSLHAAALSVPISKSDHTRFVSAVGTPLVAAMHWA